MEEDRVASIFFLRKVIILFYFLYRKEEFWEHMTVNGEGKMGTRIGDIFPVGGRGVLLEINRALTSFRRG